MSGFFFGALCLFGLLCVTRGARYRRHACADGRGNHYRDGYGRPTRRRRSTRAGMTVAATEIFKRRLDIDEDQEDIVDHALRDLFASIKELKEGLTESRSDIADAFTGETVDDGALDATFAIHDSDLARSRREVVSALKQVHAVLTPEQRTRAADWLREGRWM